LTILKEFTGNPQGARNREGVTVEERQWFAAQKSSNCAERCPLTIPLEARKDAARSGEPRSGMMDGVCPADANGRSRRIV